MSAGGFLHKLWRRLVAGADRSRCRQSACLYGLYGMKKGGSRNTWAEFTLERPELTANKSA